MAAAASDAASLPRRVAEDVGRRTASGIAFLGYGAVLLWEALYWLVAGARHRQRVRAAPIFAELMEVGIRALPITSLLSLTVGTMLAIQGIHALEPFGAQNRVVLGIALSVTREFAPLITGILVAGRSGSALAARIASMTISQEVDALRVMSIKPVRYLVVPSLVALVVMLPALTLWADFLALAGAGVYVSADLGMSLAAYLGETTRYLSVDDVQHGLLKSAIFAVLITIVAVVDGSRVTGGAEGVGRVTTRSVVHAISAIVLTDMVFTFAATR